MEKPTPSQHYTTKSKQWKQKIITTWRKTEQYIPYLYKIYCGWRVICNYSLDLFTTLWNWILNQETTCQEYKMHQKTRNQIRHAHKFAAHMDKNAGNQVPLLPGCWIRKQSPNPLLKILMANEVVAMVSNN